ncbi:MAG: acetyl-CoA carboxylase carboxyltransferase subunit alpha [Clostridia bacterium]|nr:acetyl-CoA carboxylase carboxyltransferase subunit alpha [Clostridia bacterium]
MSIEIQKQIEELKEEIKELENINTDKMIDVADEIEEAKKRLKNLERISEGNLTAWEKVEIARNPNRPTALDYVDNIFDEFMELHGDRTCTDDKAIVCGLARIGEQNYTIIAEQKGRNTKENIERNFGMPNPESYKKGIRFMKQAEKFNRPIITFIDTKGAYPGIQAEERGQGEAIARSMFELSNLKTPVIAIVIGEGSSGGALALGVADQILMLENSIYSILSPEGYASILWKDGSRKEEAAEKMKLTAEDLLGFKVIDEIIKEPAGGVERNSVQEVASILKTRIMEITKDLKSKNVDTLVSERYEKFRNMGEYIREEK